MGILDGECRFVIDKSQQVDGVVPCHGFGLSYWFLRDIELTMKSMLHRILHEPSHHFANGTRFCKVSFHCFLTHSPEKILLPGHVRVYASVC
jgi:hypothetical protein